MKSFRIKKSKQQVRDQSKIEKEKLDDLKEFFSQLSNITPSSKPIVIESGEGQDQIISEEVCSKLALIIEPTSIVDVVAKSIKESVFELPDTPKIPKDIEILSKKVTDLQNWISKIAMTGPGSGEVNLRWLDDIDRSTISDGRWLKYSATSKKFVFDDISPYQVVYNTTHVTTPTYSVADNDYYIGVDYAGPCIITLPITANSGRLITIKDEDGDAEVNPITVLGTVDNDPNGFVIQINHGAVQLIYHNGWRIV